jgi:site-specific DNA-methyltransferase (adenine-specific)
VLKKNNIYLGDCINLMKQLDDKSIDLLISDPPYNLFAKLDWDKALNWEAFWKEAKRIMKDDAAILIFSSGEFKFKLYNTNSNMYKYDLIWKKSKAGNAFNSKYMPLRKHEEILVFGKGKTKYNPQLVPGEPYSRSFTNNKKNNMGFGVKGASAENKGTRHPDMV